MSLSFADNPVVAHRGAFKKNNLPENSMAALKEAIRLKCTGTEFDIRMTLDDSVIINHDPHYKQMEIEKTSFATLLLHPLSNGETLPTLRAFLLEGIKNNPCTMLVLEVKPSASKERGKTIAARVVALVHELNAQAWVTYISFDYDILLKVKEVDPLATTQYLRGDRAPSELKADGITGADYQFSVFKTNPHWIKQAKENNILLNAWTVNEEADMTWLLDQGFDFITTNEPELLFEVLEKRRMKQ